MPIIPLKAAATGNRGLEALDAGFGTITGVFSLLQVGTAYLHQNAVAVQESSAETIENDRKIRRIVGPQAAKAAATEELKTHNAKLNDPEYAACYAQVNALWDTV